MVEGELLNLKKNGQFPDESAKIKYTQIHSIGVLQLPTVLGMVGVRVILSYDTVS